MLALGGLGLTLVHGVVDVPHGLHHQGAGPGLQLPAHLLHRAAVRRAGVVDAVFSAQILLAQGPEGGDKGDVRRVHQGGVGKAQLQGLFQQRLLVHRGFFLSA